MTKDNNNNKKKEYKVMFDKDMRERLISVMMIHPESRRYYAREIGVAPCTLKAYLDNTAVLSMKTLLLIKKYVEKKEKNL